MNWNNVTFFVWDFFVPAAMIFDTGMGCYNYQVFRQSSGIDVNATGKLVEKVSVLVSLSHIWTR